MFLRQKSNWILLFLTLIISSHSSFGQTSEELISKFYAASNSDSALYYGKIYLQKAKNESIAMDICNGYTLLASIYGNNDCIKYADSLILLTKNKSTAYYPAMGYIHKSGYYISQLNFGEAIENISLAKEYAEKHDNQPLISLCNTQLGMVQITVGDHFGAIDIFHKNLSSSKLDTNKGNFVNYTWDLYCLASAYNEVPNLDSANYYNTIGLKMAKRHDDTYIINYFNFNIAITQFHKKNYSPAKNTLYNILPIFKKNNDFLNLLESYYYLGKINKIQGNIDEAFKYFNKIDSTYIATNNFYPKYRNTYYELIKIAVSRNEKKLEDEYLNKLFFIDSVVSNDDIYVKTKISNAIEMPDLLGEKDLLITKLSEKNETVKGYLYWFIPLLVIVFIILVYQYYLRRNYKKKSKSLLEKINTTEKVALTVKPSENPKSKTIEIPDDILTTILNNLEKFEQKKGYLNPNLNINQLAKKVGSNTKYVSKTINMHKGCSFTEYINTLRINRAIERLKCEEKFKQYTIKAIAEESGFNQAEPFSRAFQKLTGVKPSYFIKDLKKESEFTEKRAT